MQLPSTKEAHEALATALRAAGIDPLNALHYPLSTLTALEALAVTSWVGQAWNNGYCRGSDDATLKHVYSGVLPAAPPPLTQRQS